MENRAQVPSGNNYRCRPQSCLYEQSAGLASEGSDGERPGFRIGKSVDSMRLKRCPRPP